MKAIKSLLENQEIRENFYKSGFVVSAEALADGSNVEPNSLRKHPSYIATRQFSQAVIAALLKPSAGAPQTVPAQADKQVSFEDQLTEAVDKLPEDSKLKSVLSAAMLETDGTISKIEKELGEWYDSAMDRVSEAYARRKRLVCFLIGAGLAVILNADVIRISQVLAQDDSVREALVASATDIVAKGDSFLQGGCDGVAPEGGATAAQDPDQKTATQQDEERLACLQGRIASLTAVLSEAPLGWKNDPVRMQWNSHNFFGVATFLKLVGLLMTAFALSLGAPFWFDLLKKFVFIRGAGTQSGNTDKSAETGTMP